MTLQPVTDAPPKRVDINPALLYFQAFLQMPQLSAHQVNRLSLVRNPGAPGAGRSLADVLSRYDRAIYYLQRAKLSVASCDWGCDLADGFDILVPAPPRAKHLTRVICFRISEALDADSFEKARDELACALALARHLSADGLLISTLVQLGIEQMLTDFIAENFHRFSPEQLDQVVSVFDNAPARGCIADTVAAEEISIRASLLPMLRRWQDESAGDLEGFWNRFGACWRDLMPPSDQANSLHDAKSIRQEANHAPANLFAMVDQLTELYGETARLMRMPFAEHQLHAPGWRAAIDHSNNPFIRRFAGVFKNARSKEFASIVRLEMLRAAAAYRRDGVTGLNSVCDPLTQKPFKFERVVSGGGDRGIRLISPEVESPTVQSMLFVEISAVAGPSRNSQPETSR